MRDIIDLLKGSDTPDADIAGFMRANIIFWLLGATDGHAKNFSLFITPGGRFRLAPAYDVLTAQPSLDAGQIPRKKFRLAMSVGNNRHYGIGEIMPRHFLQMAGRAGIGIPAMRSIVEDLGEAAPRKAAAVVELLPRGFPEQLADSVMNAIGERSRLLAEFAGSGAPTPSGREGVQPSRSRAINASAVSRS